MINILNPTKDDKDQILHMVWQGVFFAPLAFTLSPLAFFWSMQWFWPRELIDQRAPGKRWPVLPMGSGKWRDVRYFELKAIILTIIYQQTYTSLVQQTGL